MSSPEIERIDVLHLGRERVVCCHRIGNVIIDPGPANAIDNWLPQLDGFEPEAIVLTHIHLDHSAATGELVRRFPKTKVFLHGDGAPHMIDPTRLLASAGRVYYKTLEELFGEFLPVPAENVTTIEDGEELFGFKALHTPGHAGSHFAYLHSDSGTALTGDVAGMSYRPHEFSLVPTPPPEINLDLWSESVSKLQAWGPASLSLTHFGEIPDAGSYLERFVDELAWVRELSEGGDLQTYESAIQERVTAALPPEVAASMWQAITPFEYLWGGLERFWRKRAEREAASL